MTQSPESARSTGLRAFVDPACFDVSPANAELFAARLADFVPPDAFDAHAHWYDLRHLLDASAANVPTTNLPETTFSCPSTDEPLTETSCRVGHHAMLASMRRWMGNRVITDGLYFPFPIRNLNCRAANDFLAKELSRRPGSRGLMIIRPQDNPADVERELTEHRFAGFKVYHVFAQREDTFQAEQHEFLPQWAWELAHQHGLWITMHMVLPRALGDPRNSQYVRSFCQNYPNARLVLAHAARGFNASHTVEAIDELCGLDNVFFDTSAVCEPAALEAILRITGTTRLMYGSDFPVSEIRGRALAVGDGFFWLYRHNADWTAWPHGGLVPVGIESLLALRQACRTMCLRDGDIERIFATNARQLLGIDVHQESSATPGSSTANGPLQLMQSMARGDGESVQQQYRRAKQIIPGGTQLLSKRPEMFAPGRWPAYFEQAIGCEVVDTSGRRFIDMSSGGILACVLGYADPDVNAAVIRRVHLGSMATQQSYDEVRLAELLIEIHPWAEMARFARTGGEAMAIAVRIARAATGRDLVAVCGYHGWHDWYLAANLGETGSNALAGHLLPGLDPAGVPQSLQGTTLTFSYNHLDELEQLVARHGNQLAAIVMEPTRHIDPEPGFLEGVRQLADRTGARLVFDEISVGWRLCLGGAHRKFGVVPDLAVFGKALAGGFAMSAVIGRGATMSAAEGSFISSTFWTEGVGPAAAVAAVSKMRRLDVPAHLATIGNQLAAGWRELGLQHDVPVTTGGRPEMLLLGFDAPDAGALMTLFTIRMMKHGILAAAGFNPTLAHEARHVATYLAAAEQVFPELAEAIEQGDASQRIGSKTKHTTFARLTDANS